MWRLAALGNHVTPGWAIIRPQRAVNRSPRPRYAAVPYAHALSAAADMATPVVTELARRVLALSSGSVAAGNPLTSVSMVSEAMHHQALFVYSLVVTLSITIGAWIVAAARIGESFINQQPTVKETVELYGVDVTYSRFLSRPRVISAADFAAAAHRGQTRLTGAPYITHCVETALIVEGLWSLSEAVEDDDRVEASVIAALLHDVVDDTSATAASVAHSFGAEIHALVATVTQLSQINQLIRRKHRRARERGVQSADGEREVDELRGVILTMCDEPFAILIKLADRLHNMRTVYALEPHKAQAVASETLHIWCSLAERLGMFAIKSELEDLCFAVLQPRQFEVLQADLERWWGCRPETGPPVLLPPPRTSTAVSAPQRLLGPAVSRGRMRWPNKLFHMRATGVEASTTAILQHPQPPRSAPPSSDNGPGAPSAEGSDTYQKEAMARGSDSDSSGRSNGSGEEARGDNGDSSASDPFASHFTRRDRMEALVTSVTPFHQRTFKSQKSDLPYDTSTMAASLAGVEACGRQLLMDLSLNGQASGVNIEYEGRLKSLYSIHIKMGRKRVALDQIYDSRALRIVVDDNGCRNSSEAVKTCYQVRTAVQRLWKPIHSERDDYIANPKGAGKYQSLHMAVVGPGGVPLEVQLRTSSMHADAEYGAAAHWAYKEGTPPGSTSPGDTPDDVQVGQAVLQVDPNGTLSDGIILEVLNERRRLLVALKRRGRFAAGTVPTSDPLPYRNLKAYVDMRKWSHAGQMDSNVGLLAFVKCTDGSYHMQDAYGYNHGTYLVPLKGHIPVSDTSGVQLATPPKWPSAAAAELSSAGTSERPVPQGDPSSLTMPADMTAESSPIDVATASSPADVAAESSGSPPPILSPTLDPTLNPTLPPTAEAFSHHQDNKRIASQKTRMLRAMLEWGNDLSTDSPSGVALPAQVLVLLWPPGDFKSLHRGTTAGQVIQDEGLLRVSGAPLANKGLVNVNNVMVPPDTPLVDGDVIFRTDELVDIN